MVYGDGGVGKTTLVVDLTCHLAGGDDWLGLTVPRPVRVLLVENEGPRPLFRRKLERKLAGWQGSPLDDRVQILEEPWSELDFADPAWRDALGRAAADREIDLLAVGPVTSAGMEGAGTIAEARAFLTLVKDVRARSGRPLAIVLVHHENKGGKVSGAWEGTGDTLLHVQQQATAASASTSRRPAGPASSTRPPCSSPGPPATASSSTRPTRNRPSRSGTRSSGSCSSTPAAHGTRSSNARRTTTARSSSAAQVDYLTRRRDQMLADGVLINAGRRGAFELWHRDDPRPPARYFDDADRGDSRAGIIRENRDSATEGEGPPGTVFPDSRLKGKRGPAQHPPPERGPIPDPGKPASEEDDW